MGFIVPKCTWLLEVKLIILLKLSMNVFYLGIHWIPELAIHEYIYFIEIKLFKNYSNFNIEVNGDR